VVATLNWLGLIGRVADVGTFTPAQLIVIGIFEDCTVVCVNVTTLSIALVANVIVVAPFFCVVVQVDPPRT